MSKKKTRNINVDMSKKINSWDAAIADANNLLLEARRRVAELRQAVKSFEYLRDKGEPFPGEGASLKDS
jgi:hypothetical protein